MICLILEKLTLQFGVISEIIFLTLYFLTFHPQRFTLNFLVTDVLRQGIQAPA